jgi:hypothetical protein
MMNAARKAKLTQFGWRLLALLPNRLRNPLAFFTMLDLGA